MKEFYAQNSGYILFWIVTLPVLGFALIALFGRSGFMKRHADKIATAAIGLSFLLSIGVFLSSLSEPDPDWVYHSSVWKGWLANVDSFNQPSDLDPGADRMVVPIGAMVDHFSAVMLFMVTLVAFMVHLFSTGYMQGEVRYTRFFCILQIFSAAMLGLIVSDNLVTLYVCWEVMGFASYSLIGHYYEKRSAQQAAMKAFMTTRLGDVLMFIGMMILYANVGSLRYVDIYAAVAQGDLAGEWQLWAGLLVFAGAMGKSAQFPLHVWLPDAMEGPTPVSALIHAATMVAAGVYLVARMALMMSPETLLFVAYVGGFTAFFAATIAVAQDDIKKVLAYSTISQLGYMMLGLGLSGVTVDGYSYGSFHLITHAFFKACLFLGSGSIIHAMHHEQRMSRYGGLAKKMPITFATFLISTLCLTGLVGTSGFYSKDGVIASSIEFGWLTDSQHWLLPFFAVAGALLTAFYMFRLIFLTFAGKPRDKHAYEHCHESGWRMCVPLVTLTIAALAVGLPGEGGHWFKARMPNLAFADGAELSPGLEKVKDHDFGMASSFRDLDLEFGGKDARKASPAGKAKAPHSGGAHAAPAAHGSSSHGAHASGGHGEDHAMAEIVRGSAISYATGSPPAAKHGDAKAKDSHAKEAHAGDDHGHGGHGHSPARDAAHKAHSLATTLSFFLFGGGVLVAALFYWERFKIFSPETVARRSGPVHKWLLNKYYFDELYIAAFVKPTLALCDKAWEFDDDIINGLVNATGKATVRAANVAGAVDSRVVDGSVNALAGSVNVWGGAFARMQTGNLRSYLMSIVVGFLFLATVFVVAPGEMGFAAEFLKNASIESIGLVGGWLSAFAGWVQSLGDTIVEFIVYYASWLAEKTGDIAARIGV